MQPPHYQILAELASDDAALLERVEQDLSRTFKLDLSGHRGQLRRGGVCVCRAETLPAARDKAELVRGLGADYRILDSEGRLVGRGQGRRAEPDPPDVAQVGSSATSSFDMEALGTDDLVLLDGSRDELAAKATPVSLQPLAAEAFAPPREDEVLELEEVAPRPRPPQPQVPSLPAPTAAPAAAVPRFGHGRPASMVTTAPSAPAAPPAASEQEPALLEELLPTATPPAEAPPQQQTPAGTPVDVNAGRPPTGTAQVRRIAQSSGRPATARRGQVERVLFGGWFRRRARLRIVVGFVLALGLGSVVPIWQSRSVVSTRIRPELQDLSTARAHGQLLARLPNFRSPEEIEQCISAIKTRHGVITFLLWASISGVLVFLWFRFV